MGRVRFFGTKAQGAIRIADYANILDGEAVVIGNKTYEWDDDDAVDGSNVKVTIGGSDAACVDALRIAINANKPTVAVTAVEDAKDNTTLRIVADEIGAAGNIALSETTVDADAVTVSGATLVGGENGGSQRESRGTYTVTAIDVSADNIDIETGLESPRFPQVECRTSAGVPKAATYEVTMDGSHIRLNFAGATDPAAGDKIFWFCEE